MPVLALSGSNAIDAGAYFLNLEAQFLPTTAEMIWAGERQRTRILERTARGVDYLNRPFAPYSTKRPHYWYPSGGSIRSGLRRDTTLSRGQVRSGQNITEQAAARLRDFQDSLSQADRTSRRLFAKLRLSRRPGVATRTPIGIKFASYAAFKRSLGRGTVDLRGPHAPHMLQAITVSAMGDTIKLEITGNAADRAHGHNEGTRTLPRRRFFDASVLEQVEMQDELWEMMQARLDRL